MNQAVAQAPTTSGHPPTVLVNWLWRRRAPSTVRPLHGQVTGAQGREGDSSKPNPDLGSRPPR